MTPSVTRTALCLLLATASALAEAGLRCDDDLVSRGMTPVEVFERCGDPEFEQAWTDFRYPGRFVRVSEWSYNLGDNRFRRLLTFENGRLVRIETRDKPAGGLPTAARQ